MFDKHLFSLMSRYLVRYPGEDEPDYDGVHDGDIIGIRDDAPDYVKDIYREYLEIAERDNKSGRKTI